MTSSVLDTLHSGAGQAYQSLLGFADVLFVTLAVIQLALLVIFHVVSQKGTMELWGALGKSLLITAFFYLFLTHAADWSFDLFQGIIQLGTQTSPSLSDPSPMGIIQLAARMSGNIVSAASSRGIFSNIGLTLLALFLAFFILIIMGLMAADLLVTYGKFYIVVSVSAILISLGALDVTREIAKNYYRAVIGLSLQLLVSFVLLSVFSSLSSTWSGVFYQYSQNIDDMSGIWQVPMEILCFYMLMKTVPPFIASLSGISGFQNHGEGVALAGAAGASLLANALTSPAGAISKLLGGLKQFQSAGEGLGASLSAGVSAAKGAPSVISNATVGAMKGVGTGINALSSGGASIVGSAVTGGGAGSFVAAKLASHATINGTKAIISSAKEMGQATKDITSNSIKSLAELANRRNQ